MWARLITNVKAFTFAREFLIGTNKTGLVTNSSGTVNVEGGEDLGLAAAILPGQIEIFYGSGTTQSSYAAPTVTVAAWNSFIATAAPSGDIASTSIVVSASMPNSGHRATVPVLATSLFLGVLFRIMQ
jgi:carboxypeptidase D